MVALTLPFDVPVARNPRRTSPVVRERVRQVTAKARVLARLRQGPATNTELNDVCFRYGARLLELRRAGYRIVSEPVDAGLWRYRLEGEP